MKKISTIILTFALLFVTTIKAEINENPKHLEYLTYDIVYHWGPIWKSAAKAELILNRKGELLEAQLNAKTQPWADKVFRVRDTLQSTMHPYKYKPQIYKKTAYEGKSVGTDIIKFTYLGDSILGHSTRNKNNKRQEFLMETVESAYDMLSVFFYVRTFEYEKMKKGEEVTTTIFSGRRKEKLKIRYMGIDTIKLRDKRQYAALHLELRFSSGNEENSSDPIDAWLDIKTPHIPLMVRGTVSVGEVRVFYTGN